MKKPIHFILIILAFTLFVSGCQLFDKEEQVPSYVFVDSASLTPNYPDYGTSSQNITDVWVYANDVSVGCFELPAHIPILAKGSTKLTFSPGIKVNGMAATRATYPFYSNVSYQCNLSPDSAIRINPVFSFSSSSVVTFNEDFESAGIIFQKTAGSDTAIEATNRPGEVFLNTQDPTEVSNYSGVINLDAVQDTFEIENISAYSLPVNGTYTFLEFNYKTTTPVVVGLKSYYSSKTVIEPLIVLNPTTAWKKIYVNYTTAVSGNYNATNFRIYFSGVLRTGATSDKVLFDNIKLIHASTSKK